MNNITHETTAQGDAAMNAHIERLRIEREYNFGPWIGYANIGSALGPKPKSGLGCEVRLQGGSVLVGQTASLVLGHREEMDTEVVFLMKLGTQFKMYHFGKESHITAYRLQRPPEERQHYGAWVAMLGDTGKWPPFAEDIQLLMVDGNIKTGRTLKVSTLLETGVIVGFAERDNPDPPIRMTEGGIRAWRLPARLYLKMFGTETP